MKNRIFTIDEEEILQSVGTVYTVPPGHLIYTQGDPADKVYYILKGRVRVFENLYSGREMTWDVVEAGRIFGESAFAEYSIRPANVQAVNQVTLISFRMKDVLPCFQSKAEFALHFLQLCSNTIFAMTSLCSTILYPVILGLQVLRGGFDGILYGIVVIVLTSAMMNKTILLVSPIPFLKKRPCIQRLRLWL